MTNFKSEIADARQNVADWPTEPDAMSLCITELADANQDLLDALTRIADSQIRSDRRKRGMVDISIVSDLKRIARAAINKSNYKLGDIT